MNEIKKLVKERERWKAGKGKEGQNLSISN